VIRIDKPQTPSEKLTQAGKRRCDRHAQDYLANPDAYHQATKKFSFSGIYAHPMVKQALLQAQYEKCCFCERLTDEKDGDVEHFRPKAAYQQDVGQPLQYPGYYWLAYEWSNLYFSCMSCNSRRKKNLFPLYNPDQRATNHQQSIGQEQPLLIDPGHEDPEAFIGFCSETPFAIDDNLRGQRTIEILGLDTRPALKDSRLQKLQSLKCIYQIIQIAVGHPENTEIQKLAVEAQQLLQEAVQNDSEFSAAVRSALRSDFRDVPNSSEAT
jgi:uncharacterized protein (TIGR02646 family)